MQLSKEQITLLKSLSTNYTKGLSQNDAALGNDSEYNIIPAPLNCPQWACILLPCISHIPSMKLYKTIKPTEAEVRKNNKWVVYDAVSILKGDIVRMSDGDIVPADCVVLSLGMEFAYVPTDEEIMAMEENDDDGSFVANRNRNANKNDERSNQNDLFVEELVVDSSNVNGYLKPQTISVVNKQNGMIAKNTVLYAGSMILQGTCIAVVTKTGSETLLASLIMKGIWPPKEQLDMDGDDFSPLVERSEVI